MSETLCKVCHQSKDENTAHEIEGPCGHVFQPAPPVPAGAEPRKSPVSNWGFSENIPVLPPSAQPDAETKPDLHSYEAPWGRPEDWPDLPSLKAASPSPGAREWLREKEVNDEIVVSKFNHHLQMPIPIRVSDLLEAYTREREQRITELEAGLALCESDAGFIADAADAGAYSRNLACKIVERAAALRVLGKEQQ